MNGFASYGSGGFRARCVHGCPWRGPVRGLSLWTVERDAETHAEGCPKAARTHVRSGTLRGAAHMSGTGDVVAHVPAPWSARSPIKEGQRA